MGILQLRTCGMFDIRTIGVSCSSDSFILLLSKWQGPGLPTRPLPHYMIGNESLPVYLQEWGFMILFLF